MNYAGICSKQLAISNSIPQIEIYEPFKKNIENYQEYIISEKELLQVK
jgi:hypothetical protein